MSVNRGSSDLIGTAAWLGVYCLIRLVKMGGVATPRPPPIFGPSIVPLPAPRVNLQPIESAYLKNPAFGGNSSQRAGVPEPTCPFTKE